ncbi:hypothetical protein BV898_06867 [Hypsibius exemplaris]|uniref:Receptor ligand binding region domain-containing protein n=1 Tax=Hypsibius exemplaris TaxID=2072580 RepID=A0A1W0WUW9_HYPEX|nr:hypothetical protein BV898_06867 [Hypsibius exemplaris]
MLSTAVGLSLGKVTAVVVVLFGWTCAVPLRRIEIGSMMYVALPGDLPSQTTNSLQQTGAGVQLAMEYLQARYGRHFNFTNLRLPGDGIFADRFSLEYDAEYFVAQFYYRTASSELQTLISPSLDMLYSCSVGNSVLFDAFPQRISLSVYPVSSMIRYIILMVEHYQWTSIAGLVDVATIQSSPLHRGVMEGLEVAFSSARDNTGPIVRYALFRCNVATGNQQVENTLRAVSEISRIVFLFGSGVGVRTIMQVAESLGMTNGEYLFVMSTLQTTEPFVSVNEKSWTVTPTNERYGIPFQVYPTNSTMLLSFVLSYTEDSIRQLRQQILELSLKNYNFTFARNRVPAYGYALYESYLIYGSVLNETYATTGRLMNGKEMAQHYLNRTFSLPTGDVRINLDGERTCDILGDFYHYRTDKYVTVLRYDHRNDRLVSSDNETFNNLWPGGQWPPLNQPICGFLGNRCQTDAEKNRILLTRVLAGVVAAIIGLIVLIGIAVVRIWQYRQLWASTWWKIDVAFYSPHAMRQRFSITF